MQFMYHDSINDAHKYTDTFTYRLDEMPQFTCYASYIPLLSDWPITDMLLLKVIQKN